MKYVLDASALIALLEKESGAQIVVEILQDSKSICYVHAINLCEVFYGIHRAYGEENAMEKIEKISKLCNIQYDMDDELWLNAGRLKSELRHISLADCFAVSLSNRLKSSLVTSDHHEMDIIQEKSICRILFIR